MKAFLRFGFAAVALMFFFGAFAAPETKAQGVINDILKRMEAHRNSLKTLRSDVTMVKTNSQLQISDTTQGNVVYLPGKTERDMFIRISWTKPVQEELSVIKGEYMLFRPRLKQAITGKVDSAKNSAGAGNALAFMSMSKAQLKANYDVKYIGEETVSGGAKAWHLGLTPKAGNKYKSADIWIDGNGMPIQAKVVENNSDSTTVLLTNLRKNETVKANTLAINLPKGTTRIKG